MKKLSDYERLLFSSVMERAIGAVWSNGNLTAQQRGQIEMNIREACKECLDEIENPKVKEEVNGQPV